MEARSRGSYKRNRASRRIRNYEYRTVPDWTLEEEEGELGYPPVDSDASLIHHNDDCANL